MALLTYTFNPACACAWCRNNGQQPSETANVGSWCFEEPHIPPISVRTVAAANATRRAA